VHKTKDFGCVQIFKPNVPCTPTNCSPSINNLRSMIEKLSALACTCSSVLQDVSTQGEQKAPMTVLKEIENALIWDDFTKTVEMCPSRPDFLFRAHKHIGTEPPSFVPDIDASFDLEFQRAFSVSDFATFVAEHLNKTREEKETGVKVETCFVSMSPVLEWTLHTTGQKWRDANRDRGSVVGLAIFDVHKLQRIPETTIFRIADILKFLESQGKGKLIEGDLQRWALNCDEYISMGKIDDDALVRWVKWEDLYLGPVTVFQHSFLKAYTLAKYRDWIEEQQLDLEDVCQRILKFGKLLAGSRDDLLMPLVEHILRPGIRF